MSAGRDLLSCNPTSCSEQVQLEQVASMLDKFSVFPGAKNHQPPLATGPAPVSAQPSGKKKNKLFQLLYSPHHPISYLQTANIPLAFSRLQKPRSPSLSLYLMLQPCNHLLGWTWSSTSVSKFSWGAPNLKLQLQYHKYQTKQESLPWTCWLSSCQ